MSRDNTDRHDRGCTGVRSALLAGGYVAVPLDCTSGERIPNLIPPEWRPHLTEWLLEAVQHD